MPSLLPPPPPVLILLSRLLLLIGLRYDSKALPDALPVAPSLYNKSKQTPRDSKYHKLFGFSLPKQATRQLTL